MPTSRNRNAPLDKPSGCSDRDGDGGVKYDLQEIGSERRGGYTWYGTWGERVLASYARCPHRTGD
ncbi:pectate lyase [Roseimaritima multifibrata]|uniref:pectate lyase n=1 Tax=Roseimaritima multifibrata TaxID=1930274 RepID=UPI0037041F24